MKLEFPDGVRFTCQQCGDCCRSLVVSLAPGESERLEGLDWRDKRADLVGVRVLVGPPSTGPAVMRLARRADGACIYLGETNDCLLHTHFGEAAKPLTCRMYPFSFRPLGSERVMVDVAYSCSAVSAGIGAPLSDEATGWSHLRTGLRPLADRAAHPLTRRHRVDGDLLWEIEQQLLSYLSNRKLRLLDRLSCVLEYLDLATTGDPNTPAAAVLRAVMAKAIPDRIAQRPAAATALDETQRAVFWLWTYLVLNPAPNDILSWPRRRQAQEGERRAALAERFRRGDGRPWIDNRELAVTFAELKAVGTRLFTADADPVVEVFLRSKLVGQRFRFAGDEELPLVAAVRRLLLCHPIAIWTAKGLAAERGASEVAERDLRSALRLIDRTFDQIRTAALATNQRQAWEFIVGETDIVLSATFELLHD